MSTVGFDGLARAPLILLAMATRPKRADVVAATKAYESWLGRHVTLLADDLELKHAQMEQLEFAFLRATYYRWVESWPEMCPELDDAPRVLAIGDLHVENFGSWRDSEGRLAWGISDFDEADHLPYTNDLVRLATSALLAARIDDRTLSEKRICDTILGGYREGLEQGGLPFVLDEKHRWFVPMMRKGLRDPVRFWRKMRALPEVARREIPDTALAGIKSLLPEPNLQCRFVRRTAGLGSLGRPRFVALAEWAGGLIAREAKALAPSASSQRSKERASATARYNEILGSAVRCPDPFLRAENNWVVRRLAPDCAKIELSSLSRVEDQARQLHAMGWETANVHLGSSDVVKAVQKDLAARPRKWLRDGAQKMLQATQRDWKQWRESTKRGSR
jgi:hypothetical protein